MSLLDYHRLRHEEVASWDLQALEAAQDAGVRERVRTLLPETSEEFTGDLVAIDRGALFQKLHSLCKFYRGATDEQRVYIRSRVARPVGARLESFGLRAAVVGAREKSPEMVLTGLMGFAIADLITGDVRETLMSITAIFHCAGRSGGDAAALFQTAATASGPAMAAVLLDFIERPAGLQKLASMGWREIETEDGIGLRWGWPKSPAATTKSDSSGLSR